MDYAVGKKSQKFSVNLNLTYRKVKPVEKTITWLKDEMECFIVADIICGPCLYINEKYEYSNDEDEFLSLMKLRH